MGTNFEGHSFLEPRTQEMGVSSYSLESGTCPAPRAKSKGLLSLKQAADPGGPEPSKDNLRSSLGSAEE